MEKPLMNEPLAGLVPPAGFNPAVEMIVDRQSLRRSLSDNGSMARLVQAARRSGSDAYRRAVDIASRTRRARDRRLDAHVEGTESLSGGHVFATAIIFDDGSVYATIQLEENEPTSFAVLSLEEAKGICDFFRPSWLGHGDEIN